MVQVDLIELGSFWVDGGAAFGTVARSAWLRRYPADEAGRCMLAVRSLLVRTDEGRTILIDSGINREHVTGYSSSQANLAISLQEALKAKGVEPEDVTDVVLTHLHFDHAGGLTTGDRLLFPQATHWIGRAQWENAMHPHPLEQLTYPDRTIQTLNEQGIVHLIEGETQLCRAMTLRLYDGHTVGQIVSSIQTERERYLYAGDVIPLAAHLSPAWIAGNDTMPLRSYDAKVEILTRAVQEEEIVIFSHDAYTPMTAVIQRGGLFKPKKRPEPNQ